VFLTGATGFLGAFLLRSILAEYPAAVVWCLVRVGRVRENDASGDDAAVERIRAHLTDYELWDDAFVDRVRPIVGELSLERFGLSRLQPTTYWRKL
jgi:thioester reductase-like protein